MSNRNAPESGAHRKPKGSLAMVISQGLGGPKINPKGVVDGQPVNIPAPARSILKGDAAEESRKIIGFLIRLRAEFWVNLLPGKAFQELFERVVRTINRHR
jgi:hypothetical protein